MRIQYSLSLLIFAKGHTLRKLLQRLLHPLKVLCLYVLNVIGCRTLSLRREHHSLHRLGHFVELEVSWSRCSFENQSGKHLFYNLLFTINFTITFYLKNCDC